MKTLPVPEVRFLPGSKAGKFLQTQHRVLLHIGMGFGNLEVDKVRTIDRMEVSFQKEPTGRREKNPPGSDRTVVEPACCLARRLRSPNGDGCEPIRKGDIHLHRCPVMGWRRVTCVILSPGTLCAVDSRAVFKLQP